MTTRRVGGVLVGLAGLLAGCTAQPDQPGGPVRTAPGADPYKMTVEQVRDAHLETDIVQVVTRYNRVPWLQFDPSDPRPQGFMISALFLVSAKTGKGAFADGTITARVYRVDRDEQRRETRTLVHSWQFTPQQALPYRALTRTVIGEGYQLRLRWPAELDLVDREIVTLVEFTRLDGKVIRSGAKFLKVPRSVEG